MTTGKFVPLFPAGEGWDEGEVPNLETSGRCGLASHDSAPGWRLTDPLQPSLDPTAWRFSIGNFSGETGDARQFGIKGDAPDPRTVTPETGLVTYELVDWYYYDRNDDFVPGHDPEPVLPGDDIASRNGEFGHGVVLLQLGADGTLKSEVFPGKTPPDVTGFTGAAKTYER